MFLAGLPVSWQSEQPRFYFIPSCVASDKELNEETHGTGREKAIKDADYQEIAKGINAGSWQIVSDPQEAPL